MHPVLLKLGPLTLHTYGFFLAIGFLVGSWLAMREARRQAMAPDLVMDLCLYMLLAAVIGARIPYVILNWGEFSGDIPGIFKLWKGGLMFHGGFLAAVAVYVVFIRVKKLVFWRVADLFGLAVPLGHAIGRLGCFSAGCCYGKGCDLPWAVTFPAGGLAPSGMSLHPTQIYTCLGNLAIFLVLYFVLKPRKRFDGQIFLAFVFIYAIFRFCIELIRGDNRGQLFFDAFTFSQSLSIALVVLSAVLYLRLLKKHSP